MVAPDAFFKPPLISPNPNATLKYNIFYNINTVASYKTLYIISSVGTGRLFQLSLIFVPLFEMPQQVAIVSLVQDKLVDNLKK